MARLTNDKYAEEMLRLVRDNPHITETYHQAVQVSRGELEKNDPNLTKPLQDFLNLVDEDDVEAVMPQCVALMRNRLRIATVDVISAVKLRRDQILALEARLIRLHSRQVVIHNMVDQDIIGGLRIIIGDTVIDNSIKTQLNNIKQELYKGVYFNNEHTP